MSFAKPTALQMAFHEAGHAYAFASLLPGEAPVELGLELTAGGWHGWSKRLKVSETEEADTIAALLGDDAALRWIAAAEATIAIAGPLAEARQREGSSAAGLVFLALALPAFLDLAEPAIDPDFARIRQMIALLDADVPLLAARGISEKTNILLDACWPGVNRLARKLLAERWIGADAVRDHLAQWPARQCAGSVAAGERFAQMCLAVVSPSCPAGRAITGRPPFDAPRSA